MPDRQIVLVNLVGAPDKAFADVASALQAQVENEFRQNWPDEAAGVVINIASSARDVPSNATPIFVTRLDAAKADQEVGVHKHQEASSPPYAVVNYTRRWSLTASHELLELLADPRDDTTKAGPSPIDPAVEVLFVREICDPVEEIGYSLGGVEVSDFCTPLYFRESGGARDRFDFRKELSAAGQITPGGYRSWRDPRFPNPDDLFVMAIKNSRTVFIYVDATSERCCQIRVQPGAGGFTGPHDLEGLLDCPDPPATAR
jgi:hypothetical protein